MQDNKQWAKAMATTKDPKYYQSYRPDQHGKFADSPAAHPAAPKIAVAEAAAQPAFPTLGSALPTYGAPLSNYQPPAAENDKLHRRLIVKSWLKRIFIALLVVGLLAGGYIGAKFLINASKTFGGSLFGLVQNDKLDGEDQGRVNVLLAGNSADDVGHSGGDLTDSIMLISLNTKDKTAFVVSIPRDLWVNIPDHGYSKINATYVYGKADKFSESGYPDGGMGLLEKVVEQNFDIHINYYALVNYTALRDAVNAVGGVDVTIQSSDPRGLYDPSRDWTSRTYTPLVKLSNGPHTLGGQQALNLARARGDSYGSYGYGQSDFTRTYNQRLLLSALKTKALTAGVVTNPIRLGSLLDAMGNNVQTDFQTNEVRRLVTLSQEIPDSSIKSVSLNDANGKNLLTSYHTYNGQSALIPAAGVDDYSDINDFLNTLLNPPATTTESQTTSKQ
jgi:LCP family protein required for cell wall assembly